MYTTDDARAMLHLYRTTPDPAVRARANALLCAFIDQYDNPGEVVAWLLDVYVTLTSELIHINKTRERANRPTS